jgi:hypothetical protein
MSLNFGDVPTWVAAVGTVAAFGAALFQISTERRYRHEAEQRDRYDRHRAQACLISAVPGPTESGEGDPSIAGRSAIDCINASSEPTYNVVVGIVFIQGAAPRTTEDMLRLRLGGGGEVQTVPTTTLSILPPGKSRAWIEGTHWTGFMAGRAGAEIAFTDRASVHWIRRATGQLEELPVDPLEYFRQFNFFGPYEFQTPEPLG